MPTYQYACTSCGHRFEAQQAFTDATLTECPECSGRLRKVFSSVGIVFKGSGFYRTDSRSAPVVAGSSSEGKSESKSESKSSESSGSGDSSSGKSSSSSGSGDSSSGKSSSSSGSSGSSGSSSNTAAKAS